MGISIDAYSRLALTEPHEQTDDCWEEEPRHIDAFVLQGFERSAEGLELGRCYATTAETRTAEVLSMSYGGYGAFRRHLSQSVLGIALETVWADPRPETPLVDVLNFADNEGCIGPAAAKRLGVVFADPEMRARFERGLEAPSARFWLAAWDGWVRGCELAADDGLIEFH